MYAFEKYETSIDNRDAATTTSWRYEVNHCIFFGCTIRFNLNLRVVRDSSSVFFKDSEEEEDS